MYNNMKHFIKPIVYFSKDRSRNVSVSLERGSTDNIKSNSVKRRCWMKYLKSQTQEDIKFNRVRCFML